jgi:uncharacterized RDD family membrane protein YckC
MSAGIEQGAAMTKEGARARAYVRAPEARFERLRAPFSLRCGALLIDYMASVVFVALATLLARATGGGTHWFGLGLLTLGYVAAGAVAVLNFVVLPTFTGRTVGKWVTDLRIERRDGEPLSYGRALLRHLLGYALTLATLGLGFLLAAFSPEGRALHDLVAGTVVVRNRSVVRARRGRTSEPTS